jgi:hypothetical protein
MQTRSKGGSSSSNVRAIWSNMCSMVPTPTLSQASSTPIPVVGSNAAQAAGRFWNGSQSSW